MSFFSGSSRLRWAGDPTKCLDVQGGRPLLGHRWDYGRAAPNIQISWGPSSCQDAKSGGIWHGWVEVKRLPQELRQFSWNSDGRWACIGRRLNCQRRFVCTIVDYLFRSGQSEKSNHVRIQWATYSSFCLHGPRVGRTLRCANFSVTSP